MASRFDRSVFRYPNDTRRLVTLITDGAANQSVINTGDFLLLSGGYPMSAVDLADQGTKLQNQQAARDAFLGIAQNKVAASGASKKITIARRGPFNVACASATYAVNDLVGLQGTGTASAVGVSATTVEKVTDASAAIGRVIKGGTTVTRITIEIFGINTEAPSDNTMSADTISELTANSGVTVDGVLLKDAGIVAAGTFLVGGTDVATVKGIYLSGTIAVAVPTIANDAAENVDSVAVDVSAMTFAPAVGDAVIAIPQEALPTDCLQCGAYVTATDQVTVTFGSKEGGGGVTGANKNYKFLFIDLT